MNAYNLLNSSKNIWILLANGNINFRIQSFIILLFTLFSFCIYDNILINIITLSRRFLIKFRQISSFKKKKERKELQI